jgi:hypothetical protein
MSDVQGCGAGSPLDSRRDLTREEARRELQNAQNIRSQSRARQAAVHAMSGRSEAIRRLVEIGQKANK